MSKIRCNFMSLPTLIQIAQNYSTRREWKLKHNKSYKYALKSNFIDICAAHMPKNASQPYKIKDVKTGKVYYSIREAAKATKIPFQRVYEIMCGHKSTKYKSRFTVEFKEG